MWYVKLLHNAFVSNFATHHLEQVSCSIEYAEKMIELEKEYASKYHVLDLDQQRYLAEVRLEKISEKFHTIESSIDEAYFAEPADVEAYFSHSYSALQDNALLFNMTTYTAFFDTIKEFMYIVYLLDLKYNNPEIMTSEQVEFLEGFDEDETADYRIDTFGHIETGSRRAGAYIACPGGSVDETVANLESFLNSIDFFKTKSFSDWWYDDTYAYYERINKVFYEG